MMIPADFLCCRFKVKIVSIPASSYEERMDKGIYRIISSETMAKGWSSLSRLIVAGTRLDGRKVELTREVADHGHGAAILPIDPTRGTCLLVRQWRAGAASAGHDGWLIEACAGLLDADHPEECVRREALEELGTRLHDIKHLLDCFTSPGAVSERLSLFMGRYSVDDRLHDGGGLHHEDEDIEVLEMPLKEAFGLIASGGIVDAKTIILLQHAMTSDHG
jgi:nudix-type nucleoside diphosphatase (YffH/AdpP family)